MLEHKLVRILKNTILQYYYSTITLTSYLTPVLHPLTGHHGHRRRGGTPHPLPFFIVL